MSEGHAAAHGDAGREGDDGLEPERGAGAEEQRERIKDLK